MEKKKLDKMVEETINSMDAADKAMPAPFLLTRIHARMNREREQATYWERAIGFLTKPIVAFPAIALVLIINFWMMHTASNEVADKMVFDNQVLINDGYSINTATSLFDIENKQQP